MSVKKLIKDFYIGINKISVEIVERGDQCGLFDTKKPEMVNIRQGIERFFANYNTHGVVQSDVLTVAIWRQDKYLYMFDSNPRGPTGIAFPSGTACLMQFHNALLLSDHLLSNIPKDNKLDTFTIIPLTVHVVKTKSKFRQPKKEKPCCKNMKKYPCDCPDPLGKPRKARPKSKRRGKVLPKTWVQLKDPDATILLASFSQNSQCFSTYSRGYQAAANAVVAIVMYQLNEPSTWTSDTLNSILQSGDQLYKDSYLYYKPATKEIGLQSLLRRFYVEKYRVQILIFKPCIVGNLNEDDVSMGLYNFFLQERAGIFESRGITLAVFQKGGQCYVFDPYDRDETGNVLEPNSGCGIACLLRFRELNCLASRIVTNLGVFYDRELYQYQLSAIQIKDISLQDTLT